VNGRPLWVHHVPAENQEIRAALASHCPFVQSSVLFRREAFVAVGGYRTPFAPAEDYDLWLRMSERVACANITDVLLKYRLHTQQVSLRNRRQQSLGFLAAQVSSALRRANRPDLLDKVTEITPHLLSELGVSEAKQQAAFFAQYLDWIRSMFIAREYSFALMAARELLQANWQSVERSQIADLKLMVARLHWNQGQYFRAVTTALQAALMRPHLVWDLFDSLFAKLGLTRRPGHSLPSRAASPMIDSEPANRT
jgi:hypothetical protein